MPKQDEIGNAIASSQGKIKKKNGTNVYWMVRKISLNNYDPKKKFETEDYGCTGSSFEECRQEVEEVVANRIKELKGFREVETKE